MQFGLYKIWFSYSDEWYYTNDVLATQVGLYDSYEAAERTQEILDIKALRKMGSYDYIRDLTGFMEKGDLKLAKDKLVAFAKEEGWDDCLREQTYYNSEETFYELSIPKDASDGQLKEIINITGAYFHRIVEYKEVKKTAYIKFNHEFWGTKIFKAMKADGIIEDRNPFINEKKNKGKYFIQKPPNGRKSATIRDIDAGLEEVIRLSLKYIHCLLYTSPSPRDATLSRMPSSA